MNIHPPSASAGGCPEFYYETGDDNNAWEANIVAGSDITNSKQVGSLRTVIGSTSQIKNTFWSTVDKITLDEVTSITFNVTFNCNVNLFETFSIVVGYGNNKTSFVASDPSEYSANQSSTTQNFTLSPVNVSGDFHISLQVVTNNSTANGQVDINEVIISCSDPAEEEEDD